MNENMLVGIMM